MTPFHSDESHKDLRKKWAGTFVQLYMEGAWVVFYISDFSEKNTLIHGNTQHGIVLIEHENYHWDVSLPPRGWFNFGSSAIFARRYSYRQWRQGLCEDTMGLERPTWRLRATVGPLQAAVVGLTLTSANAVWNPEYLSWDHSIKSIQQHRRAEVAISREFMIMANPFGQNGRIIVFYDKNPVCEFDTTTNEFLLETDIFHQEIVDYIRRNNLPCSVKFI